MHSVSVCDLVTVRRAAGMQLRLQEASEDLHEHLRLTRCIYSHICFLRSISSLFGAFSSPSLFIFCLIGCTRVVYPKAVHGST